MVSLAAWVFARTTAPDGIRHIKSHCGESSILVVFCRVIGGLVEYSACVVPYGHLAVSQVQLVARIIVGVGSMRSQSETGWPSCGALAFFHLDTSVAFVPMMIGLASALPLVSIESRSCLLSRLQLGTVGVAVLLFLLRLAISDLFTQMQPIDQRCF